MVEKKIPMIPVYVDSPMAIAAMNLFYQYPFYHKVMMDQQELAHELETKMLVFVKSGQDSKALNNIKENAIIISSSGMMTGGRILHHMMHRLGNPQDTFLIAGYQAEGTRGRKLLDKSPTIKIFGKEISVHCTVEHITALSGHADKEELFRWMGNFRKAPAITFTVHGEGKELEQYAQSIRERMKWNVVQPQYLQRVTLFKDL